MRHRTMARLGLGCVALLTAVPAVAQETVRQVSLSEALELARRNNPTLDQSRSNLEIAQFNRLSSWGQFLPTVNLSYSFSDASSGRLDPTGQRIVTTSYSTQLRASYELFGGLRRFSSLKASGLGVSAQEARLREQDFTVSERVKVAFFNAVANRDLVRVEQDRVARQEDQLSFVRQQLELGRATRSDILRSQVDLNNAKVALLNAENSARASLFDLAEAVGVTGPVEPVETAELETKPLEYDRAELLAMGLRGAPSLVSAQAQANADEASVASARSAYLPTLLFSGGWAWQNSEFPPKNRSWSLSLSGNYPLFNGFTRESNLYRARATADQSRAAERAAELSLRTQLDAAANTIESALASVGLAEQTVELSREDLRVTQERYRLGLATILDLQAAQITLRQAEVDLIRRRFDYQLGLARLEALLGTELRT
ncbi:MAG: TolC family protein [Gemmatimonadota bacterium]